MPVLRKSFTLKTKLKVIQFAQLHSNAQASREYHIYPSMVSRWRKQEATFLTFPSQKAKRPGSGRKAKFPELEIQLQSWLNGSIQKNHFITQGVIQLEMLRLEGGREIIQHQYQPETLNFKASSGWVRGFMKRCNLSMRVPTTHTTPQEQQSLNGRTKVRIQSFHEFYQRLTTSKDYSPHNIINMDETPSWGSTLPHRTLNFKGAKDVSVIHTHPQQERVTVIHTATADGTLHPPCIIRKSLSKNCDEKDPEWENSILTWKQNSQCMTQNIFLSWIQYYLVPLFQGKQGPTLLIMDSFSAHKTDKVKLRLAEMGFDSS